MGSDSLVSLLDCAWLADGALNQTQVVDVLILRGPLALVRSCSLYVYGVFSRCGGLRRTGFRRAAASDRSGHFESPGTFSSGHGTDFVEAFLDRAWGWSFFGGGWRSISMLLPECTLLISYARFRRFWRRWR